MTGRLATAKNGRHRPQAFEAEIEVRDGPREQEVQRCAAALLEHDLEDIWSSGCRPMKSGSASSSCGGHASSWW